MACEEVHTGKRFLAESLAHIDCQAQTIGSYGYGALSDPSSAVFIALTSLLTIFIAIFGFRLLLGEDMRSRTVVGDMLRLGIVLTLATSWPAWRTLGYDVVIKGPAELSALVGNASGLAGGGDLASRLQSADDGIVLLTIYGTGRTVGGTTRSSTIGDSFQGIALPDQEGFSDGRLAFLIGVLAPLAIVRLGAGLLLALAPLMAGLLLFAGTRDLFFGWFRGLGALALSAASLAIICGVELAILEPWLREALALRDGQVLTPSTPTELSVITISFMLVSIGMLFIIAKIFFFSSFSMSGVVDLFRQSDRPKAKQTAQPAANATEQDAPSRAYVVAEAVSHTVRREERALAVDQLVGRHAFDRPDANAQLAVASAPGYQTLGESFRAPEARRYRRTSEAGRKRDNKP
jgi:type IV secretion system protein VirB6